MLQPMGSQRIEQDLATKQQQPYTSPQKLPSFYLSMVGQRLGVIAFLGYQEL